MWTVSGILGGGGRFLFAGKLRYPVSGSPLTAFRQLAPRLVRLLPSPGFRDRLSSKKPTEPAMWADPERSRVQ